MRNAESGIRHKERVPLYPMTFTPVLRDYIWGGRNLERLYGRPLPPGPAAESWEISAHPTGSTVIDAGPLQGYALPDVFATYGVDLVGRRATWALQRGRFPLLVKLLDAEKRLSVQVHPPDEYALQHENGELGKTEMWYVLHAQPDARIILGLRRGVTRADFLRAIAENCVEKVLHSLPVKPGDAVLITPGTVHAALEGLVINEVLQNSDTTYRVYDWGRVGADGRPRPLHVEKALDVLDFCNVEPGVLPQPILEDQEGVVRQHVVHSRHFVVEKVTLAEHGVWHGETNGETLEIWGCIAGEARLEWSAGSVPLPAVRYCLVPAAPCRFVIRAVQSPAVLLRIYLPPEEG
ncbi:MAG: type I phosphomannose isomerase catalytic subunit [Anaerolineae bacterium]